MTFKTGALPTNLTFPTFTVQQAPAPGTDLTQNMVFHVGINPPNGTVNTLATDLTGQHRLVLRPGGQRLPQLCPEPRAGRHGPPAGRQPERRRVARARCGRSTWPATPCRETNIDAVNAELAALGQHSITDFNHDAQRLPNGDTAVLATTPRTIDLHGTPTTYNGDMVIVLDQNFQVAWVWDPFAWLDTNRLPTLGEGPGDWLHANSIAWSPADGNLMVSMRSQDWVIKIDYANGAGDGHVVWRLGQGGDFTLHSVGPIPVVLPPARRALYQRHDAGALR